MSYIVNSASNRANGSTKPAASGNSVKTPMPVPVPTPVVAKTTTVRSTTTAPRQDEHLVNTAMKIISEESGVVISELIDSVRFEDIGVDSLLGLMVSSRIRDELDIELDSNCFLEVATVHDFKNLLRGLASKLNPASVTTEVIAEVTEFVTPETQCPQIPQSTTEIPSDLWEKAFSIILEESGVSAQDLTPETLFADIGVDSLLSLVAVSRMKEELDIDVPEQALFIEYPTVRELQRRITGQTLETPSDSESNDSDMSASGSSICTPNTPLDTPSEKSYWDIRKDSVLLPRTNLKAIKPAWSLVLQGSSRTSTERLFLFPDGCGAATSYLKLPVLSPTTMVVAFNSPFMK